MADNDDFRVGERLRQFREHLKLTQAQMAYAVGGSLPGYKANEKGSSLPNSKLLMALRELGVNLDWLLMGEGPMLRNELLQGAGIGQDDIQAYGDCLEILEIALSKLGRTLPPQKKRLALDSMYRAWTRDRKIDHGLVDMIVQLAA